MRRSSIGFASCLIILSGCIQSEKQGDALTEKEVRDVIVAYDSAWNAKDRTTVGKLLGDKYVYFTSDGKVNGKTSSLDFLADSAYVIHQASRPEIEIIIQGNVATVNSHWIGHLSWKGQDIHDNQRCGLTIAKINGKTQIIAEHCVAIASE